MLASLWLLESVESVWRSPATVCLNDYLKHLAVFSPEVRARVCCAVPPTRGAAAPDSRSRGSGGAAPRSPALPPVPRAALHQPSCTAPGVPRSAAGWASRSLATGQGLAPVLARPAHNPTPPLSVPTPAVPQAVVAITADWKASFQQLRAGVVAAQVRGTCHRGCSACTLAAALAACAPRG